MFDPDAEDDTTYIVVKPRQISIWNVLGALARTASYIATALSELMLQFAYIFFGKAQYEERKQFQVEASRSIETITGGE